MFSVFSDYFTYPAIRKYGRIDRFFYIKILIELILMSMERYFHFSNDTMMMCIAVRTSDASDKKKDQKGRFVHRAV